MTDDTLDRYIILSHDDLGERHSIVYCSVGERPSAMVRNLGGRAFLKGGAYLNADRVAIGDGLWSFTITDGPAIVILWVGVYLQHGVVIHNEVCRSIAVEEDVARLGLAVSGRR